jgi:hypothetical protein
MRNCDLPSATRPKWSWESMDLRLSLRQFARRRKLNLSPQLAKSADSATSRFPFASYRLSEIAIYHQQLVVTVSRRTLSLDPGNRLVLQYSYCHATILRLSLGAFVIIDLSRLSHRSRRHYPRQWHVCFFCLILQNGNSS